MNSGNSRRKTERTIVTTDLSLSRRLALLIFAWSLIAVPIVPPSWGQQASTSASKPRVEKDLWGKSKFQRMPTTEYRPREPWRISKSRESLINHYPGFVEAWAIVNWRQRKPIPTLAR